MFIKKGVSAKCFYVARQRCRDILQSDGRQGNYFDNNFIYSFYYKGVKIDVGISYTKVEFFDSNYLRGQGVF